MLNWVRLIPYLVATAVWGLSMFWSYNRGKDSVIKNVVAGATTTIKQQEKAAEVAVQQATVDTTTVERLKTEKKDVQKKLQASVDSNPRADAKLSADELLELQNIARATQP